MGSNGHGTTPLMAVRFGEQPDGACVLVVEPDPESLDDSYLARILDCEQNEPRDLTVESIDVAAGGGENRW